MTAPPRRRGPGPRPSTSFSYKLRRTVPTNIRVHRPLTTWYQTIKVLCPPCTPMPTSGQGRRRGSSRSLRYCGSNSWDSTAPAIHCSGSTYANATSAGVEPQRTSVSRMPPSTYSMAPNCGTIGSSAARLHGSTSCCSSLLASGCGSSLAVAVARLTSRAVTTIWPQAATRWSSATARGTPGRLGHARRGSVHGQRNRRP
jgi:hypothetical protein